MRLHNRTADAQSHAKAIWLGGVERFEEAFEIDIPDEDTEKIRTVQDAIDYIEKHAKK